MAEANYFEEVLAPVKELAPRIVLASLLSSPKLASSAMKALSEALPLDDFGLLHVKRIHNDHAKGGLRILLAPPNDWWALSEALRGEWAVKFGLGEPSEVLVPADPSNNREEFEAAKALWPQNYHPPSTVAPGQEHCVHADRSTQDAMLRGLWAAFAEVRGDDGCFRDSDSS